MTKQMTMFEVAPVASSAMEGETRTALESDTFPYELISKIAEQESWRKEVNRPIYHIHKWWAQRLGSVFRALALGAFSPENADIVELFHSRSRIAGVVFDPFMGSGTTLGEVLKLGGRAIGQDINPVSYFLVENAVSLPSRDRVIAIFNTLKEEIAPRLLSYYSTTLPNGRTGQVLYFFWVKQVPCPQCTRHVDLFPSYVFAQHAYPAVKSEVRIVCPRCGGIHVGCFGGNETQCPECLLVFNPLVGPAKRNDAICPHCHCTFAIADSVKKSGTPPQHRMYAKLVLRSDGEKQYLRTNEQDSAAYARAEAELAARANPYPVVPIKPGNNTDQAMNYGYRWWHQMFNARQLLCLDMLATRIRAIQDEKLRNLFTCLFSGTLEFNNMFASYKGEGTGAVRHMFSHHVLKPERMPIEANIWGTSRSSGSFSTLFKSRILRAIDYAEDPFELDVTATGTKKVFGISVPMTAESINDRLVLRCGDSSCTGLRDQSVDAVITDPPFFDNVHYSELADFFYVWQRHIIGHKNWNAIETTRAACEVQHANPDIFEARLTNIWRECHRVLKHNGLLVFTFHHSRPEGWKSLLASLNKAKFRVICVHPIKSELSVAAPKQQAKNPISYDVVFVCRKLASDVEVDATAVIADAEKAAAAQISRLAAAGLTLSRNDVAVMVMSNGVRILSGDSRSNKILESIRTHLESAAAALADRSHFGTHSENNSC